MPSTHRFFRLKPLVILGLLIGTAHAAAQLRVDDEFISGDAEAAWLNWNFGLEALLSRDREAAEGAFGVLLADDVSPLRLALMAERSQRRSREAGAVLLMEQDYLSDALGESGRRLYERLEVGREQMNQADDGWYFASIGRYDVSNANFRALIASEPDPVALLEFADRVARREQVLVQVATNPVVGDSAMAILRLLAEGERLLKADPVRIRRNIERLGGPPRAFENAVVRLKESGEYAVPFILQTLRDPERRELTQALLRTLPQLGRSGLNPLVIALRMDDETTKEYVVRALGQIGYWQPVPYLLALREDSTTSPRVRMAVDAALSDLADHGVPIDTGMSAAEAFYRLARGYYDDSEALAADPRLDTANVWYWRDGIPQNVEVPTAIFNEIMSMRCCEEALRLSPDMKPPLALWLAANFRREAQLPEGMVDYTRPDDYPSAAYFAQAAGAEYNLRALARAVDDGDPAVALGAIEALRLTAGRAALMEGVEGRHPLAQALSMPDRLVRIRAGLALGGALPTQPFANSQNLMPVLGEALRLYGGARGALVADPDTASANAVAAALRAVGYDVVTDAGLLAGLQKVRDQTPGVDAIVIGSNVMPDLEEAVRQIRSDFRFAHTPVLIVARPGDADKVRTLVRSDHRLGEVAPDLPPEAMEAAVAQVARAVGARAVTSEIGSELALEAAFVLRQLALTDNPVFKVADAQSALLEALKTTDPALRLAIAEVLGFIGSAEAQRAIAQVALDDAEAESMRVSMFAALAEAARRTGGHLPREQVDRLIETAEKDPNMTIRTAASQALGALNLPANPASTIIRNQYRG